MNNTLEKILKNSEEHKKLQEELCLTDEELLIHLFLKDIEEKRNLFFNIKNNKMDIREKYWAKATEFAKSYGVEASQHIIEVMASAMMTRDNVMQGGSFVQAVVKNDLASAVSSADPSCLANIRIIVLASRFARVGFDMDGFPEPEISKEEHLDMVKEIFKM